MERTSVIIAAIVSLSACALSGIIVIPWLKRLKYGQTIKEIGPVWHKDKQGTPTMGGIMIVFGVVAAVAAGIPLLSMDMKVVFWRDKLPDLLNMIAGAVYALLCGLIGFLDDYIKIAKHRNLGLRARFKMVFLTVITAAYLFAQYLMGNTSTALEIPYLGTVELGIWYYVFCMLMMMYMVNAVNLTDGIDGLASSTMFVSASAFFVVSALIGNITSGLFAVAVAGACAGFCIWNLNPARVFMGDTGSFFLGGALVAMAFSCKIPLLMLLIGIVFVLDAGSVVLQVCYFKLTKGKRIFKMTPIHHSFELDGWSEMAIVGSFCGVQLVGCAAAVIYVMFFVH